MSATAEQFDLQVAAQKAVISKLVSQAYKMEPVGCFCGSSASIPLCIRDRYGIPYIMRLCQKCGLLYASPQMTQESYHQFYNTEYRQLYLTADDDVDRMRHSGACLLETCQHFDVKCDTVLDVGCNQGEMLRAFIDAGSQCTGIDWDADAISKGRASGLPVEQGSPADLIARGLTFDFVILNHVLEHCPNLEQTLDELKQLLKPGGTLFVGVPGLKTTPKETMFQLAHVWTFSADTLEYVMDCCGWTALYMNETIHSFWRPMNRRRDKDNVIPDLAIESLEVFTKPTKIPVLRCYNKFPVAMQRENIQAVLDANFPDLSELMDTELNKEAIVIAGGPSVEGQLPAIRRLIDHGCKVVAIERMQEWCWKHGIIPDYLVVLDASDDVPDSIRDTSAKTVYCLATQSGAKVAERLKQARTYTFSTPNSNSIDLYAMFNKVQNKRSCVVNGGGSVAHYAMSIAAILGMHSLHVFGFDCHITQKRYADGITGVGAAQFQPLDIEIEGKPFVTTPTYFAFAQQFFQLVTLYKQLGFLSEIKVYGDSLVTALSYEDIKG